MPFSPYFTFVVVGESQAAAAVNKRIAIERAWKIFLLTQILAYSHFFKNYVDLPYYMQHQSNTLLVRSIDDINNDEAKMIFCLIRWTYKIKLTMSVKITSQRRRFLQKALLKVCGAAWLQPGGGIFSGTFLVTLVNRSRCLSKRRKGQQARIFLSPPPPPEEKLLALTPPCKKVDKSFSLWRC